MAQTVPQLKKYIPPLGVSYRPDPDDADDVHIVAELATRPNASYHVEVAVLIIDDVDYDVTNSYRLVGTFQNDNGTLSQVGTTTVDHSAETDAGWSATFAVDDTNDKIQVQVTLDASHTSSAPVFVRTVPLVVIESGKANPFFYGSSDNNP